MLPKTVRIEWMTSKWQEVHEDVPMSRVKTLDVGMEIKVSYKSGVYKVKIVNINCGTDGKFKT